MRRLGAPKLLLKMTGQSPKSIDPPGWTLEAAEQMVLHNDSHECAKATRARDTPESVPEIIYATAGSVTEPLSETALFFSSSRLIINLKSWISSSGGSVGGMICASVISASSASLLDLNTSDSLSLRSFSFMSSFHA